MPSGSVAVAGRLHSPWALAVVVYVWPSTTMLTVALASAVPLRAGVLSLVSLSPCVPVSLDVANAPVPAAGGVVSSVKAPAVAELVFPATSVIEVLVVQAPSTVSALLGMIWLIVKGPEPVAGRLGLRAGQRP